MSEDQAKAIMAGLSRGEPVDFKSLSEPWSQWIIHDTSDVRIKGKAILAKAIRTEHYQPNGDPVYGYAHIGPFWVAWAPRELTGKSSTPAPSHEEMAAHAKTSLKFDVIEEPWCEYQLTDGTLMRLKVILTGLWKTDFFGLDGNPIYWPTHDMAKSFVVPAALKRKDGQGAIRKL